MSKPKIVNASPDVRIFDADGDMLTLAAIEKEVIRRALTCYGGHMTEVARRLGIGRSTLYRKMSEYGLA